MSASTAARTDLPNACAHAQSGTLLARLRRGLPNPWCWEEYAHIPSAHLGRLQECLLEHHLPVSLHTPSVPPEGQVNGGEEEVEKQGMLLMPLRTCKLE